MVAVDCTSPSTVDAEHRSLMPRNTCPSLRSDTPIIRRTGRLAQLADTAAFAASTAETDWLGRLWSFRHDDEALAAFPGNPDRARELIAHARSVGALDDSTECWWLTPQQRLDAAPELASLARWHDHPPTALASRMATVVDVQGDAAIASVVTSVLGASGFQLAHGDQEAASSAITIACAVTLPESSESALAWMPPAAQSRPHLPVVAYRGRASIGPLVVPGHSACLRCGFLHRRDRDPQWPEIVSQWMACDHRTSDGPRESRRSRGTDALLAMHAAAHAVAVVRRWTDRPQDSPTRRIFLEAPDFTARDEPTHPHPACGCWWGTDQLAPRGTFTDGQEPAARTIE